MTIGIVGLGYVGLPLAVAFAEAGHQVIGIDVEPERVAAVNQGSSHVEDVPSKRLRGVEDRLVASTSYAELEHA
jgi:UDP-N-acetyl-D-glucosamine dehydrogenase